MIAIRCARLFTGERFGAEPATLLVDGQKIIGVEPRILELDESWDAYDYPTGTVLPGLIDTHVHLVADNVAGALDRVPELGEQALNGIITESLRRQLAAGVTTVRDLGDYQYAATSNATAGCKGPSRPSWRRVRLSRRSQDTATTSAVRSRTRARFRRRYANGSIGVSMSSR